MVKENTSSENNESEAKKSVTPDCWIYNTLHHGFKACLDTQKQHLKLVKHYLCIKSGRPALGVHSVNAWLT